MQMQRLMVVSMLAAVGAASSVGLTASGVVYGDANQNGVRDGGEAGIADVLVSNGQDIVKTDAQGRYSIEIDEDDAVVFAIKPRDFALPTDGFNIPRFWYVHRPAGSPDDGFIYPGVEPTGALPASIDFGLVPSPEPDAFKVIFLGDPQPYTPEQVQYYADEILPELAGHGPAFVVTLGDLVGDDLDLYDIINDAQARVGVPVRNVYGNHDMNFLSPNDLDSDETFMRVYGPATHAFRHGDVHFLIIDNVVYNGFHGYDPRKTPWTGFKRSNEDGFPRRGNYHGGLRADQLAFIENYLEHVPSDQRVVLCMHIPLIADDPDSVHKTPELAELMGLLSGHPHTLSFSAHTHINRHWFIGSEHGYTPSNGAEHHHYNAGTASGSWWRGITDLEGLPHATMADGTPNGYVLANFDGNEYSLRFVPSQSNDDVMRIMSPRELQSFETRGIEVHANIWGVTGARSTARVRTIAADGTVSSWKTMAFLPQNDPLQLAQREREEALDLPTRSIPTPRESHNMFEATIDVPSAAGLHYIEVEATDMFGQTVHERKSIVVR